MNILFLEREKLLIPFKCYREDAISPLKAYPDSAGHDLYANETKILSANGRVLVRIDLNFTILKGFFGQIVERLGLANLHGICALMVSLTQITEEQFVLCSLIFLMMITRWKKVIVLHKLIFKGFMMLSTLSESEQFPESKRGVKGFGSSLFFRFLKS